MTSSLLLPRVVEVAATYLVQSSLFLIAGWLLLKCLSRQWVAGVGASSRVSPALTEAVWKCAAVLALVTAPLSVFLGWSRPVWDWSVRETPEIHSTNSGTDGDRLDESPKLKPREIGASRGRPPLPEEVAALNEGVDVKAAMSDEGLSVLIPFLDDARSSTDAVQNQSDTDQIVITPGKASPPEDVAVVLQLAEPSATEPSDSTEETLAPTAASVEQQDGSAVTGLAVAIIVWLVLSVMRLAMRAVSLQRRLSRCSPVDGELRQTLNGLLAAGPSIRLLQCQRESLLRTPLHNNPFGLAPMDSGLCTTGPGFLTDSAAEPDSSSEVVQRPASHRGKPGGVAILAERNAITEPFACGVFRWTIVLPAGIERQLSPVELKALLAHEVAHLVRRDTWWLWLGEVLCTCFAFQPLNFLARHRWQQATELLCDDWAVERHVAATSLANCLARIAEGRLDRRATVMGLTAVGHAGSLTHRVEWLLRPGRATEPKRPRRRRLLALLAFSAGLLVGTYGPRLSLVTPAEAHDETNEEVGSNESELWNDIDHDLSETLNELTRLDLLLSSDPDPETASLANGLRQRAASLRLRHGAGP